MHIENDFFKIVDIQKTDCSNAVFCIELLPECSVYEGHFPGNPVCPGVFNIETIKECAEILSGKSLRIDSVKQCRFTSLLTPVNAESAGSQTNAGLNVRINVKVCLAPDEEGMVVQASIYDSSRTYVEFKGHMIYD